MPLGKVTPYHRQMQQATKTVAATGTPERLVATAGTYLFQFAVLFGKKAPRTDNTSDAYVGVTATDDTQPYLIPVGLTVSIEAPEGMLFDLYDFYLDVGTNGDGVVIWYV